MSRPETQSLSQDVRPHPTADGRAGPVSARYASVRAFSCRLCAPLAVEDYVVQSMTDASPAKWHLAHTTWFFETFVLQPACDGYRPYHPAFAYLFNSYYNALGPQYPRPERGMLTRPTVAEVYAYREHVDSGMAQWLESAPSSAVAQYMPVLELGLNHEQQHQELLVTDIKHALSINPLKPLYGSEWVAEDGPAPPVEWIPFDGGVREVGHAGPGFAFDNEGPRHRHYLDPYLLASRPVTNGEYLAFLEDGAYERPELWLSEGWATVRAQGWRHPIYWQRDDDGGWRHFTLAGMQPLDLHETASHLSYFEADAYARWAGARLPTEAEWEHAAAGRPVEGHFADRLRLHPEPARPGPGLRQVYGDVWEWTASPYAAYPGYRAADGALGEYNGKFMCNQMVLRGGSCATPAGHVRPTYRNFFPPYARWQFAGARLAKEDS